MNQKRLKDMKERLYEHFIETDYNSVEVKHLMESYLKDIGDYPLDSLYTIAQRQGLR